VLGSQHHCARFFFFLNPNCGFIVKEKTPTKWMLYFFVYWDGSGRKKG
jgi:hypothetical protein